MGAANEECKFDRVEELESEVSRLRALISESAVADPTPAVHAIADDLASIFDRLKLAVLICDATKPGFPIVRANSFFEKLTGYPESEVLNRPCSLLQGPETSHDDVLEIRDALRHKQPFVGRILNYRKDGSRFWNELSLYPIFCSDGRLVSYVGALRETAPPAPRHTVGGRLREMERIALELSTDGVWDLDLDTGKMEFSAAYATMLGFRWEEMSDDPFQHQEYTHPDDRERVFKAFESLILGNDPELDIEYRKLHRDGHVVWVKTRATVVERRADGSVRRVVGTNTDITATHEYLVRLRESEVMFRQMADNSPAFIWMLNPDDNFTYVNKSFTEFLGKSFEEIVPSGFNDYIHPEHAEKILAEVNGCIDKRKTFRVQYKMRRGDGDYRWVYDVGVPRIGLDGKFLGYIGSSLDVTERVEQEEERRRLEEQLVQARKMESLATLAGGVAHDFNNMLISIIGNMELALMDLPSDSEAAHSIKLASNSARTASRLTKQMMAFSGRMNIVRTRIDAGMIAMETAEMMKITMPDDVEMEVEIQEGLPRIHVEEGLYRQAVGNLIQNAMESLKSANGKIRVSVKAYEHVRNAPIEDDTHMCELAEGTCVVIGVTDNGCGMSAEEVRRAFEPFYSSKFIGRGIGLALVLGTIRNHDGAIAVRSAPGAGTTFRLYFPVNEPGGSA